MSVYNVYINLVTKLAYRFGQPLNFPERWLLEY